MEMCFSNGHKIPAVHLCSTWRPLKPIRGEGAEWRRRRRVAGGAFSLSRLGHTETRRFTPYPPKTASFWSIPGRKKNERQTRPWFVNMREGAYTTTHTHFHTPIPHPFFATSLPPTSTPTSTPIYHPNVHGLTWGFKLLDQYPKFCNFFTISVSVPLIGVFLNSKYLWLSPSVWAMMLTEINKVIINDMHFFMI